MTQKEHQLLLLKDICARLPNEVKANVTLFNKNRLCVITGVSLNKSTGLYSIEIRKPNRELQNVRWPTNIIKPYLRPMSSMTKEERDEYTDIKKGECNGCVLTGKGDPDTEFLLVDWLNSNHFDYRGLIENGLALEAPEGIYNIK